MAKHKFDRKAVKRAVLENIAEWGVYGYTKESILACIRKNVRQGNLPRFAIGLAKRELGMR